MTLGLRNATQTFQCFMNSVLEGLGFEFCYLDDILIASSDEETHQHPVRTVLGRLSGLCINVTYKFVNSQEDEELEILIRNQSSKILQIPIPDSKKKIYCDTSTNYNCAYIYLQNFDKIFSAIDNLSHPGIRSTTKLITKRFIWFNMKKDCQLWTRAFLSIQRFEVHRHTQSALGEFKIPPNRFGWSVGYLQRIQVSSNYNQSFYTLDRSGAIGRSIS
ncbi:integrase catalytic domain-containing protein [Nephila pilipes]|uniref:Integrase catalytic domain-containing protein n=1 Tax=Nephila pilipes TaxID=299642 RepID=A0A8X6IPB2_NEPPI|nr:integrase catalytic domain-containing protein [Nephila pilipes]